MFVRVKKINNKEYAYLVENSWTRYGSRQKVLHYLGKVVRPEKVEEYPYPPLENHEQAILALMERELRNHGFTKEEDGYTNGTVHVSKKGETHDNGKDVVVAMNEGFLCKETIQQALQYTPEGEHEKSATKLASVCVEAGIKLSNAAFLRLFELHHKQERPTSFQY